MKTDWNGITQSPDSPTLYTANRVALQERYPEYTAQWPSPPQDIVRAPRSDGYYSARIQTQDGAYTISELEDVALDQFAFRREIRRAIDRGTDLIYLLGVGLGYRLRAAWETVEYAQRGQLIVLEESLSILDAACQCADLRKGHSIPPRRDPRSQSIGTNSREANCRAGLVRLREVRVLLGVSSFPKGVSTPLRTDRR